ncbi:MAG: polysaccharide deacetylase family protein [Candidatus Thiodiazotropha sp. DIVDIV]
MRLIKTTIKNTIAYFLYYTGLLSLVKNRKLRNKAFVLAYHRILPEAMLGKINSTAGIITDSDLFLRQLGWLKSEFHIIDIDQMQDVLLNGRQMVSNGCLVTFDDGWLDNYEYARTSLTQEEIPATIFLPYNYIGEELVFWQEEMLARFSQLNDSEDDTDRALLKQLTGIEAVSDKHTLRSAVTAMKCKDYREIYDTLDSLREHQKEKPVNLKYDAYMTWHQVNEMAASKINFGSHALSHRILTQIEPDDARHEISESRRLIEEKIGTKVNAIAYPNGNCDTSIEKIVSESGFQMGFIMGGGYVSQESNPMALPRINVHTNNSRNKPVFLCTILNIF